MIFRERVKPVQEYAVAFFKWGLLGLLMGMIGGPIGAAFHHVLHFVTEVRRENGWLILLLPVGGLLSVGVYYLFRQSKNRGTNQLIDSVLHEKTVSPLVAPLIFIVTSITHLFGGSAGREGAALQMGGSVGSTIGKLLKLNDDERTVLTMSGMSAVFAGLFGTPLTACVFVLEFASVGRIFTPALVPCFLSAFAAWEGAQKLGVHGEAHLLETALPINLTTAWQLVVLAVLVAVLGIIMCRSFHAAEHFAAKKLPNPWVRIAVGGAVVAAMTVLVGDQRFNGAGMDMALAAVEGNADWYSFAVKLIFTAVTLAAGFKGGEIVPTFCIGATFGCVVGGLLGMDPGVAAALAMVGLFCCGTNTPLGSIVLSIELFGTANLYLFAFMCVIVFLLSGHSSLYGSQVMKYSKISMHRVGPRFE
ncbi:MAG: chloride channel protein [Oscillospiraceae bacterium]|nr:chloride channel protein [Oscillospiraceae bacterium]